MKHTFYNVTTSTEKTSKRVGVIVGCILIAIVAVLFRLFDRSVLQTGLAENKALAQQTVTLNLNPFRGEIFVGGSDATQRVPVALNEPRITVNVVPKNLKDPATTAQKLAPIIGMDEKQLFALINNDKPYIPPVKRNLPLSVSDQISQLGISAVTATKESYRVYPEGSFASQLLGFVNGDGEGQYGIEQYYNNELQGITGQVQGQRDGWGNVFFDPTSATNTKGANIVLSIDRDVQSTVEKMLSDAVTQFKAKSGSVTIVDPKTGKIIAMANVPTYDPNNYRDVPTDQQSVFQNGVISRTFEAGSVMKGVSVASALDAGKITKDTTGVYGNSVKVDNYEIHTATNVAFGKEQPKDVLANSDNVAMVDYSARLGRELLFDYMSRFNFSKKTGVDLSGEATGSMPALKDWHAVNTATISFGQGISTTPLQMTMAYAALANGGKYMKPEVADSIIFPDGREEKIAPVQVGQVISDQTDKDVTDMLVYVVTNGHAKRAGVPGYVVAAKTGTAQIAKADGSGYEDGKNNGSLAGFAPVGDPKFAMFVTMEEPQGVAFAESSAAPVWGQIATYLLKDHFHVAPTQ